MSTIAPGRFFTVTDAASFVALSQQNWVIASEELFRRVPTYQNGSPSARANRELRIVNRPAPPHSPFAIPHSPPNEFVCTEAGTLGTWRQTAPATVTADPASGNFPTGYLIVNVADGGLKRHAGAFSWETQIGASTGANIGFHGATPTAQRANADQAEATDLTSVITLTNELRAV